MPFQAKAIFLTVMIIIILKYIENAEYQSTHLF